MRARFIVFGVAAAMSAPAIGQSPHGQLTATLRALDASFVCPELLASDDARRFEVNQFGRTLAAAKLSYAQAVKVRQNFLSRHACGRTANSALETRNGPSSGIRSSAP